MENTTQAFKAINRIVLNNWHYIDHKVLGLNQNINFFTGHSGSGKSTVIDAMQIVLYANTDGRGFFNKAAADDSDRSLIEYLRGMINIGENNQAEYKRNRNFSTTIVLELEQTLSHEKECVGVVFDVETSTNEINRIFFWHRGGIPEHLYRVKEDGQVSLFDRNGSGSRAMAISELKEYLVKTFGRKNDNYYYTSNNETFRRNLYDVYLGGLDMEKFPRLFKRAIPFRMNIKLEDFVKEYICMEQDIHIEDMQESVILYGNMQQKIRAAVAEMEELTGIGEKYQEYRNGQQQEESLNYRRERLTLLQLEEQIETLRVRGEEGRKDLILQKEKLEELQKLRETYARELEEIQRQIASSGYSELEREQHSLLEQLTLLERSERRWNALAERLSAWEEEESTSNQTLWDVEKFCKGTISGEEITHLKADLRELRTETERQRQEASTESRSLKKEADQLQKELNELQLGKKAYPKVLEEAQMQIRRELYERTGKMIPVRILADLLDIKNEKWRNALEGYLGWNKLTLIVEPAYIKEAMEIYEGLDSKKYWRVALADTARVMEHTRTVQEHSLAEEIECREAYVRSFINYLLGGVIKCETIEELRRCRVGVTPDCLLYQNFQLRRLDPENYTRRAFIGEKSLRRRQKELQTRLDDLTRRKAEFDRVIADADRVLGHEFLSDSTESYLEMLSDTKEKSKKEQRLEALEKKMRQLGQGTVEALKRQREELSQKQEILERNLDAQKYQIYDREKSIEKDDEEFRSRNEELENGKRELLTTEKWEAEFAVWYRQIFAGTEKTDHIEDAAAIELAWRAGKKTSFDVLLRRTEDEIRETTEATQRARNAMVELRLSYLKQHPGRDFSATAADNTDYDRLLEELSCDRIREYEEKASRQARIAVEHFKEDFIFKIRSAIKEAFIRRDELNRIIRRLNFGKDRYQFKITRNRGADGEYYDMFMDDALEIDPSTLSGAGRRGAQKVTEPGAEKQMNLFSMDHENRYGMLMNDLIQIFIPPTDASAAELEEAKRNMERYADYRTYLSFEMEQIIEGEERLVIGLSKMIKKNSGGEGQNPLYVALLASFAQAYHINLSPRLNRRPTIRLVVLDEAFSKMDAEKVASCIELIRGLGFQAIISATNDKIQNYLENVDKTFVYANPNKKSISIQEFEKKEFGKLELEE